tara:strand:+ start:486 stop:2132 length:1647 start_codon:yes stop_codon:yes gene_type:complete
LSAGVVLELASIGMIIPVIEILAGTSNYRFVADIENFITNNRILNKYSIEIIVLTTLFLVFFLKNIFLLFLVWYQQSFSILLTNSLSNKLINKYLKTDYSFHLKHNSSELMRNINTEIGNFNKSIIIPLLYVLMDMLIFIGIIVMILSVENKISILIILFVSTLFFSYLYFSKKILNDLGLKRLKLDHEVIRYSQEAFQGIKLIKIFGKEIEFIKNYLNSLNKRLKVLKIQSIIQAIPRHFTELTAVTAFILIVFFLLKNADDFNSIVPQLSLYVVAAFRMIPCINRLTFNNQTLRYGKATLDKLYNEFSNVKEYNDNNEVTKKITFNKEIKLENVSFSYRPNSKLILDNIDFEIKKGEIIGIIGKTGEGKTTFVDVMLGLLTPNKGKITVDDLDVTDKQTSWRDQIGYVSQLSFLMDATVRQNIIFSFDTKNFSEVNFENSIKYSRVSDFIENLPNKLDTNIGEKGVRLSGGQQQRIAIARALYKNPKVIILDEATSALDLDTEESIINDIVKLKGDKTIIIISHRESTLKHCDHKYEIKNKNFFKK